MEGRIGGIRGCALCHPCVDQVKLRCLVFTCLQRVYNAAIGGQGSLECVVFLVLDILRGRDLQQLAESHRLI